MAAPGLGGGRLDDNHGRALLLRTGGDDAARRRSLRFSSRSLRPFARFSFRLDAFSRHSNRHDRRGRDCLCEICGSLRAGDRHRSLSHRSDPSLWRLRHQSFDRTTRGRRADSPADLDKYARSGNRKICPEHIYVRQNGRPSRADRHWPFVRLEGGERGALVGLVGLVAQRLEPADRAAWLHHRRRAGARVALWQGHGGSAFRANRLDECDLHRKRSARAGAQSGRALYWPAARWLSSSTSSPTSLTSRPFHSKRSSTRRRIAWPSPR